MAKKLLLSLLALTPAGTAAQCLSSSSGIGLANYDQCCSGQASANGREISNGVEYDYHCASWMEPDDVRIPNVMSARDCARRCHNSASCAASAWHRSNWCYLSPFASDLEMKTHPEADGWLALRETQPKRDPATVPPAGCDAFITQCEAEKKTAEDERDHYKDLLDRASLNSPVVQLQTPLWAAMPI
ncbi:uncharacterized protein DSM5745_10167 [Aspergillus mulundensis]|uniref:Apple domain-containing protein n=1 Tax=Aspergillus mulundensis TaxID=1810919 RepID=A0A3D8QMJ3_9EURO|nr:hypothetical protein DSM5745_10167 [Aspergillus mulundensis]RDW63056.1 hypothetical protein DSM5745_10167 [Aspergillus mulundensis]